eukprot:scaffold161490_cov33-Prasinocladus_malaysianus.AAC.6
MAQPCRLASLIGVNHIWREDNGRRLGRRGQCGRRWSRVGHINLQLTIQLRADWLGCCIAVYPMMVDDDCRHCACGRAIGRQRLHIDRLDI